MSKGTRVVPVRIPPELLNAVDEQIKASNPRRQGEPWTRSQFILDAIAEKLHKMKRSATRRKVDSYLVTPPPDSGSRRIVVDHNSNDSAGDLSDADV